MRRRFPTRAPSVHDSLRIRRLSPTDMGLVSSIDRSEHQTIRYSLVAKRLTAEPIDYTVPAWDLTGDGEHSVAALIAFWAPVVERGAAFLGAFDNDEMIGFAIVDGDFEPDRAWLGALYVSRPHRRRGVASALWAAAVEVARNSGAPSMYVSATPSDSAVGFYLSRGCELAGDRVHPRLLALEPEDIHFVCPLS